MPVKPVEKKAGKNDMKKAQGGQDSYAQWDEGRYDREGYGLPFRSPVSEDSLPPVEEEDDKNVVQSLDYKEIVRSPRKHRDQSK